MNITETLSQKLGVIDPATGNWKPGVGNRFFQSTLDDIRSRPPSPEREAAIHKHFLSYIQPLLGPTAAQEIRTVKGGAITRQAATQAKVEAQQRASRENPTGTSTAPVQPQSATPSNLRATIEQEYRAQNNGSNPTPEYMISEMMKRSGFGQKRA
jgi:hypothetical protein